MLALHAVPLAGVPGEVAEVAGVGLRRTPRRPPGRAGP
jgi:hypothetical protein